MLYLKIINKIYKTENIMSAEFSKLLENIYRSVNISLINELTTVTKNLILISMILLMLQKQNHLDFKVFILVQG